MTTATHPHTPTHPRRNETTADRVVRVVVGLVLVVTGATGFCPLYAVVGFVPRSLREPD